jgi:hypothetical protein
LEGHAVEVNPGNALEGENWEEVEEEVDDYDEEQFF